MQTNNTSDAEKSHSESSDHDSDSENTQTEDQQSGLLLYGNKLAHQHKADVVFFNGLINRMNVHALIRTLKGRTRKSKIILLLITPGGDPDAAYMITRHLQSHYGHFSLFVAGFCKSAGTLIALGAHELIFSDHGELGPLDVQLSKKDELGETQSGLVGLDALAQLQNRAFDTL